VKVCNSCHRAFGTSTLLQATLSGLVYSRDLNGKPDLPR